METITFDEIDKQLKLLDENIKKYADLVFLNEFYYLLQEDKNEK